MPDAVKCARCGGLLAFELEDLGLSTQEVRHRFAQRRLSNDPLDQSGVWRYRDLLPPIEREYVVTLRENAVPLYQARTGASYTEARRLSYLHLGANPTASFKDAGMTVAMSQARQRGARVAVCASTGNTSASMAAYAARAGIAAVVLIPSSGISQAKMAQTLDYGATVIEVDGDFDRALELVRSLDPQRIALVNSVNPYRIEGQKCAALWLLEMRDWRPPDWVVMPGGNLGNSSAFGKGFREACALGLTDRVPRLAVVQASGAAPFSKLFRDGGELVPVKAKTSASAIEIGNPASWRKALREVQESGGVALDVSDEEIADARAVVGRDGIGCEPGSAAAVAGVKRLREEGVIGADEDVIAVLTGHVLKDGTYAAAYHASDARFANKLQRISDESALRDLIDSLQAVRA
ncbi:MAG TPA: threonine synthase [Candidatus Acidoferrales bacterium]|nr:threonine synthase [Candidatus Acidoferrales bacterium]